LAGLSRWWLCCLLGRRRRPGADWADHGWYILINGKQQWVYEGDIEDDSDLLEDT
jgi:hypothetical protein